MNPISVSDLMHLSIPERIQLVADLWDSIAAETAADPGRLALSENQRDELARRSDAYRQNPGEAIPLDSALADVEAALRAQSSRDP